MAPNWCLLSSTSQFVNGIPKSLILPGISSVIARHFQLFLVSLGHLWLSYSPFPTIFRHFHPFPVIPTPISNIFKGQNFFKFYCFFGSLVGILCLFWCAIRCRLLIEAKATFWTHSESFQMFHSAYLVTTHLLFFWQLQAPQEISHKTEYISLHWVWKPINNYPFIVPSVPSVPQS